MSSRKAANLKTLSEYAAENDLEALAKLDDAEIAMVREEININELIDGMKGNYQEAEFLIEEKGTMRIIADIAYIRRMLKCLLDNAVRCRTAVPTPIRSIRWWTGVRSPPSL